MRCQRAFRQSCFRASPGAGCSMQWPSSNAEKRTVSDQGERLQQEVQPAPTVLDGYEDGLELASAHDIAGKDDRRLDLPRQRLDIGPGFIVAVGDGEVCARAAEVLR